MQSVNPKDVILVPGEWEHRTIHAHGSRFHIAVQGSGPLVVLLHGFPTNWYLWRNFLGPLAESGFTVAALDMRGYGATDHPPRGYDPRTLAADVTGVIRAMGFHEAIVIGHGLGGLIAWTAATLQTQVIRAVGIISSAHPNTLRKAIVSSPSQAKAMAYVVGLQTPWIAERSLVKNDARAVGDMLNGWMAPAVLPTDVSNYYRKAFQAGKTSHCSLEYHRWAIRSLPRADGRRFASDMDHAVTMPLIQIHGANDAAYLIETAMDSTEFAGEHKEFHVIDDAGHLLPEERADEVITHLKKWLATIPDTI